MNAYSIQQNALSLLAALVVGLALLAAPDARAESMEPGQDEAGFDQGLLHLEFDHAQPGNPQELRRLLSAQTLNDGERRALDQALDGLYEELG